MQKTYREIETFLVHAGARLEKVAQGKDTKFLYALKKMQKKCSELFRAHLETREDIEIEHAATDKDGVILKEANGVTIRHTKDGMKARTKALREAYNSTVEFQPHYAPAPDDITEAERDAYEGIVLAPAADELHLVESA